MKTSIRVFAKDWKGNKKILAKRVQFVHESKRPKQGAAIELYTSKDIALVLIILRIKLTASLHIVLHIDSFNTYEQTR